MDSSAKFSNQVADHLTEEVISFIRTEIAKYQGQEIIFGGKLNTSNTAKKPPHTNQPNSTDPTTLTSIIDTVEILSRGNKNLAPLVSSRLTEFDIIIHNHPSSYLEPSDADLGIAGAYGEEVGFAIVDNRVEKINIIIPIPTPTPTISIEKDVILNLFRKDGYFAKNLSSFESRSAQISMIEAVVQSFNENRTLICEAETGTGKSLSYGVVAGYWALLSGKKVVISTNTIHLQEQLLRKDLPIIRDALKNLTGKNLEVILVKGKNNYLCQTKFIEFKNNYNNPSKLDPEEQIHLRYVDEIINWGEYTQTGDKNELSFIPDHNLWNKLGCEIDTCKRTKCKHEEKCFQNHIKKAIQKADILIVNHHILCADLAIKKQTGFNSTIGLLPPYERLIIDESHHLEDIATIYFGSQTSTFELKQTMGLIASIHPKKQLIRSGVLRRIVDEVGRLFPSNDTNENHSTSSSSTVSPTVSFANSIFTLTDKFIMARKVYEETSPMWYEKIFSYFEQHYENKNSESVRTENLFSIEEDTFVRKEFKHRFNANERSSKLWEEFYYLPLQEVLKLIDTIRLSLTKLYEALKTITELHRENLTYQPLSEFTGDLKIYLERIVLHYNHLRSSTEPAENDEVRWVRVVKQKHSVQFYTHTSPLEVGKLLKEYLFHPLKTVVLTSATLSTNKTEGFKHIKERWGIADQIVEENTILEVQLSNGFDYAKQCLMLLPNGLPEVNTKHFSDALVPHLSELLRTMRGRMLWLFTSYSMMRSLHKRLTPIARELQADLWLQGEQPRHELIHKMKSFTNGVLMGVSSFWEGVDIKGDHLSCLVMIKLPFAVPDEPVLAARLERLETMGKNPFNEYSLPQAILRFKQGFGRLIRGEQDRGVFILFDKRILSKYYGKAFLAALPNGVYPQSNVELSSAIKNHLDT